MRSEMSFSDVRADDVALGWVALCRVPAFYWAIHWSFVSFIIIIERSS